MFLSHIYRSNTSERPGDHDPGAGHRLSRHLHASSQENRLLEKDNPHGRGNVDSAGWSVPCPGCTEHESERGSIHSHMLFLMGCMFDHLDGSTLFRWVSSPTTQELIQLTQIIARRVGRFLERQSPLEQDTAMT